MQCETIDSYFNVFFVQVQLKKQNLKSVSLAQECWLPNQYTSLPNGQDTSLLISVKYTSSNTDRSSIACLLFKAPSTWHELETLIMLGIRNLKVHKF